MSHDAVGEVLEAIVEFGGDRPHAAVHHLLHQQLELLLSHAHVEPLLEVADGTGAMEARKLRTWGQQQGKRVTDGNEGAAVLTAATASAEPGYLRCPFPPTSERSLTVWMQFCLGREGRIGRRPFLSPSLSHNPKPL